MSSNPYIGSSLDDLLEEGQISQAMVENKLTKTKMAKQMKTSRASLDRLLDPENTSVTLSTIERAAKIVGKRLRIDLVDAT